MANLHNDVNKMYERYNDSIRQMNHILSGNAGKALTPKEYWAEISRKEAVKMGNRIKKVTGIYPDNFFQIANKPLS